MTKRITRWDRDSAIQSKNRTQDVTRRVDEIDGESVLDDVATISQVSVPFDAILIRRARPGSVQQKGR